MDLAEIIGKVRFIASPRASERLGAVAFNWNRDGKWDVFIYYKDGNVERITSGRDSFLSPAISPRGDVIAYLKDRDGDENFQVIVRDLASERESDVTADPAHYHFSPRFSPDGSKIAFLSNRGGKPSQLFVYDGEKIRELTRWSEPIGGIEWISNDEIVYEKGIYDTEIRIVDVEGSSDRQLLRFPGAETSLLDVDRSRRAVLFSSNVDGYFDIGEIVGGEPRWLYRSEADKEEGAYWQGSLLVTEFKGGETSLLKISDRVERLDVGVSELAVDGAMLAYVKSTSDIPSALVVNGKVALETTPPELKGRLVPARAMSYESFDDVKIEAIVYEPEGWKDAVVYIHGGPDAHVSNSWCSYCQLLALSGYLVIAPNYRGSTGYGKRFLHMNDKDLGGGDRRDVAEAARLARKMGARKVFALGGSYGGYLTALTLVKEPELWDGGVAIVGFYNWYTEVENEADYLKAYDAIKMDKSLFHDRSPIFHLHRLSAPVLFIHGANDPRCPVSEVKQMSEELRRLGKRHELVIYEDEGHSIRNEKNRIDAFRQVLRFLGSLS